MKFLLDKGADTYSEDAHGKTAENYASKLLETAGNGNYPVIIDKAKKAEAAKIVKMLNS